MAIAEERVAVVTVGDLLKSDLRIPHYQRPYSWEPDIALQLLDDIRDASEAHRQSGDGRCVLGAVILHDDGSRLNVVDGQQRLLTLRLLQLILTGVPDGHPPTGESPVAKVRAVLTRRIGPWSPQERVELEAFMRDRCEMVKVVTDDVDEAFRVFDSQNYRGKSLAPHDLLKAHHLRHMPEESEAITTAVVEAWESAGDDNLDRLFSAFLYRIACWSRGRSALPGFTVREIGIFKGIPAAHDTTPHARYHAAAQIALPAMNAWAPPTSEQERRDASRTRFQMDAPITAGRHFFEMVAYMLQELKVLRAEAYQPEWEPFSSFVPNGLEQKPGASRYRYVSELYLAALLYYSNRFGDSEITAARQILFTWPYAQRVELQRVQFRSIDGRARGDRGSPFALFREAATGGAVHQVPTSVKPRGRDHERKLSDLLQLLGES